MLHNSPGQKKKEKKEGTHWYSVLFQNTSTPSTHSGFFCSENQCAIRPQQSAPINSAPQTSFAYFPMDEKKLNADEQQMVSKQNNVLSVILPPDYYEAMKQAASTGFLYSFISATPAEFFNHYFKERKFTADQIYYANLTIRTITILALSAYLGLLDLKSLCTIIGSPVATILLKTAGAADAISQFLPLGVMISTEILSDLSNVTKTLATISTAAFTGWLGNQAAQLNCNLMRNGFFAMKNQIEELYASNDTISTANAMNPKLIG